jgi:phosphate transport system protein
MNFFRSGKLLTPSVPTAQDNLEESIDKELEALYDSLFALAGLIEQQLAEALLALRDLQVDVAERVIAHQVEVQHLAWQMQEAMSFLFTYQNLRLSDTRLLLTILAISAELQKINAETKRLARVVLRLQLLATQMPRLPLQEIGEYAAQMLHAVLDAAVRRDVELAWQVFDQDSLLDKDYVLLVRRLQTIMIEDADKVAAAIECLWALRALEQIGDYSRNIGEQVIYLLSGKMVHSSALLAEKPKTAEK